MSALSATIDGNRRIGMVAMRSGTDAAIATARETGFGLVSVNNIASPTGAIGYWARDIARAGLIGIVMCQSPELVAPHGAAEAVFGTNPLAVSVPYAVGGGEVTVLDMATSAVAYFALVEAQAQGLSIPEGVAIDEHGDPTTDAREALKGALLTFGGYKGSHLALVVELLAGALGGGAVLDKRASRNWGNVILALDPALLGPPERFKEQGLKVLQRVKDARRAPGAPELFLPGERGDRREREALARGTIELPAGMLPALRDIARGVPARGIGGRL
mmetsp:Transcript_18607/g.63057  ORF Transcript_18607/g.63057 Transcript_18607/m.63057 type:complete len:275 (-) Transcript_18607:15-839(-)